MINKLIQPRIISGSLKNSRLQVPQNSRPITDRVKTVLFDTLRDIIDNSAILDLFAGSGSLGIEALSRGSKLAIFVDSDKDAFEILKQNLSKLKIEKNKHKIFHIDYLEFIRTYSGNFDIIFLDPPFKIQNKLKLEPIIDLLAPNGIIVYKVEDKQRELISIPEKAEILFEKKVGINVLLFIKIRE